MALLAAGAVVRAQTPITDWEEVFATFYGAATCRQTCRNESPLMSHGHKNERSQAQHIVSVKLLAPLSSFSLSCMACNETRHQMSRGL